MSWYGLDVVVSDYLPKNEIYLIPFNPPEITIGSGFKNHNGLWVPEDYSTPISMHPSDLNNDKWTWDESVNSYVDKYTLADTNAAPKAHILAVWDNGLKPPLYPSFTPSAFKDDSYKPSPTVPEQLAELFPNLLSSIVACPKKGCIHSGYISNTIIHLNDRHKWSREQIADWLETLDVDLTMQPASIGN